jgi:acylphosphatase
LVTEKIADRIACLPAAGEIVVSEELSAKRYYVSGMVQGVGYRYFVERVAFRLKLAGYVRNLRDGRVEVYAIALKDSHALLRRELERGPGAASVSNVAEEEATSEAEYASGFSIEFDA